MSIIPVVKHDSPASEFVWKYPNNELSTWTQLIVNESQEAVLFKGGEFVALFTAGRYTLNTANIPFIRRIINLPFGGRSPFTAEVWFVNKTRRLDIRWGTPTPVQLQDPKYGIFAPVRTNGLLGLRIVDTKCFLAKIVGTLPSYDDSTVANFFRGVYITQIKDAIAQYVTQKKKSLLELNSCIDEISVYLKGNLEPFVAEYGLELVHFSVTELCLPEDDSSVGQLRAALSKRAEIDVMGYTYQEARTFDVLEGAAKNRGSASSTFMGAGIGIGLGQTIGETIHRMAENMTSSTNSATYIKCANCGASLDKSSQFCNQCGSPVIKCCPKCNAQLPANSKFCPSCGEKI